MIGNPTLRPSDRLKGDLEPVGRPSQSSVQTTILLVEHDARVAVSLAIALQDEGFRVLHAVDDHWGLKLVRIAQPDLILMDMALSRTDSLAMCHTLRRESAVPIIILSPRATEQDCIKALEIGADHCIVKPFGIGELLARVRATLRRRRLNAAHVSPPDSRIVAGDILLDRTARQVWRGGRAIELRRREFDLLCVLMENAGQAISRHQLLDRVWGEDWIGDPRTVDVHVCWLRRKLEVDSSTPRYIQTVHGYGYRFVDPAALPAVAA